MLRLSREKFQETLRATEENGRALEKKILHNQLGKSDEEGVFEALKAYQNEDGGFGGGLEPDFQLSESSPMSTSVALRIISENTKSKKPTEMLTRTFNYLENVFNEDQQRWYAVPKTVNEYPHAPWWHFKDDINMTVIDYSWGNPSAEIIAYMLENRELTNKLDVDALNEIAIKKIEENEDFQSEHEIYCYIPLYNKQTDEVLKTRLERKIEEAVGQLLCRDESKWFSEYLPKPLDFVWSQDSSRFGISEDLLNRNLDLLIKEMEEKTVITPTWEWGQYEQAWQKAKKDWTYVLTLRALLTLKAHERIDLS